MESSNYMQLLTFSCASHAELGLSLVEHHQLCRHSERVCWQGPAGDLVEYGGQAPTWGWEGERNVSMRASKVFWVVVKTCLILSLLIFPFFPSCQSLPDHIIPQNLLIFSSVFINFLTCHSVPCLVPLQSSFPELLLIHHTPIRSWHSALAYSLT